MLLEGSHACQKFGSDVTWNWLADIVGQLGWQALPCDRDAVLAIEERGSKTRRILRVRQDTNKLSFRRLVLQECSRHLKRATCEATVLRTQRCHGLGFPIHRPARDLPGCCFPGGQELEIERAGVRG